ncbi:MAG TPA: sugar ABC transporter permease [Clostridiaceae bacterium]|nr:sugar ABC transporter permease [Clostridiaceae bacterium]
MKNAIITKNININVNGKKQNAFAKEISKNKALFLMLVPGLILLIIFNYMPMFGLVLAFKDFNLQKGFFGSDWVGFRNFKFLFATKDAFLITRNVVIYNLVFIFLGNMAAVFVAVAINELKNRRMSKVYQSCIFLPYFLSWVVVSYLLYAFLNIERGFINRIIVNHFNGEAISWYMEPKYWPFIIVGANLWKYTGYNSVVYLAAIMGIDKELYEAAEVDGASKWCQIRKITLPLLTTMMSIMILMGLGRIFRGDFGLFYQLPLDSGALYSVTNVIDTYVYRALMTMGDIGMSSAAGFYQAIVGFVLVLSSNAVVRKMDSSKSLF